MTNYSFRIPKLTIYKDVDFYAIYSCMWVKYLLTKSGKTRAGSLLLAADCLSTKFKYCILNTAYCILYIKKPAMRRVFLWLLLIVGRDFLEVDVGYFVIA